MRTEEATAASASATKETRSRPRTLASTVAKRWPCSRVTWIGPSSKTDLRDLAEFDRAARRRDELDALEVGRGFPQGLLATQDQRRADRALQHDAEPAAVDPDPNRLLHFVGVEAETAGLQPVDADGEVLPCRRCAMAKTSAAPQGADAGGRLGGDAVQLVDVIAEDLQQPRRRGRR